MGRRRKSFYKKVARERPQPSIVGRGDGISLEDATEKPLTKKAEVEKENDSKKSLYPNCDTTIWLRSCEQEVTQPVSGTTVGSVPLWLRGSLLRNGPGSLKVGEMEFEHLFDSSALLHRFNIHDGEVTYQNRFLQSETFKKNHAAQRIVVSEFGTSAVPDPCHTIFDRISAVFHPSDSFSDNAMISIYPFGDKLFAMTETPIIHEIDDQTLETGQRINLGSKLGIMNHTSHPHVMPDGSVYNLGMTVSGTRPHYCIIHFPSKSEGVNAVFEEAKIVAMVPSRWRFHPSYMHTFGITENFFIIVEQPLCVAVTSIVKNVLLNQPIASALQWYQKAPTHIYLVSRRSGKVEHTYQSDSFFYLHTINQYEEDGHVVLDICCYKDPSMLDCMYISALKEAQHNPEYASMFRGRPLRFVLPLRKDKSALFIHPDKQKSDANMNTLPNCRSKATALGDSIFVTPELLCTLGCETPRINYERNCGKKYRYFYAISSDVDSPNPGTLIKVDVVKKSKKTWGEVGMYPSEPIFVGRQGAMEEDDGVVISAVVWGGLRVNQVGLIVLDARSFTLLSRTTFDAGSPVPKCLHGWFVHQAS